jgi:hypothetical protein
MIKLQNEKEKLLTTNWHNAVVVVSGITLLPPLYEPWRHVIPTSLRTLASRYSHHSTNPGVTLFPPLYEPWRHVIPTTLRALTYVSRL